MANLRIIYNNIADSATVTASNTASGFSVDNLKNNQKTSVHRTTDNTVVYTLTWTTSQYVSCVALPATNLKAGATVRVQLYSEIDSPNVLTDTGNQQACTGRTIVLYNKTSDPTYVDFGFGGDWMDDD